MNLAINISIYKSTCLRVFLFIIVFTSNLFSQDLKKEFEKTDKLVEKFQKRNDIPGISISISVNDSIIYSKGFGYSNLDLKTSVDPSVTKFRIASMTKSLTALSIGRLVELGLIDLDKSVHYYLEDLPLKKYDFTVRDLGGHLSGMIRVPSGELYNCNNTYTKDDFYLSFEKDDLIFAPKSQFSYSNYGYKLLGLIIEKIWKKDIVECHKDLVLSKLNLESITPDFRNNQTLNNNFYIEEKGKNILAQCLDCTFKHAQGCYLSTSEDFTRLANSMLYIGRLLEKETLLELIKSQKTLSGQSTRYGFGFMTTKDVNGNYFFGHNGGYSGTTTQYRVYPNKNFVITILTNKSGNFNLDELINEISYTYLN